MFLKYEWPCGVIRVHSELIVPEIFRLLLWIRYLKLYLKLDPLQPILNACVFISVIVVVASSLLLSTSLRSELSQEENTNFLNRFYVLYEIFK